MRGELKRVFIAGFLILLVGCSGNKSHPSNGTASANIEAFFDVRIRSDAFEIKKDEIYREIADELKDDKRFACVTSTDKKTAASVANIYADLVRKYDDPIVFISGASTSKQLAGQVAEQLKANLGAASSRIFQKKLPGYSCGETSLRDYHYKILEADSMQGLIKLQAGFTQKCQSTSPPQINMLNGSVSLDVKYAQVGRDLVKFEAGKISYRRDSFFSIFNKKAVIEAFNQVPEYVTAKPEANTVAYDNYRLNLKRDLTSKMVDILYDKRFSPAREVELKMEKIYKLDFAAAVARMQRKLDRYSFDSEESSFKSEEEKNYDYCRLPIKYRTATLIKLFPESQGRTAAVLEYRRKLVHDNLLSIDVGEEKAKSEFREIVSAVDGILNK